MTRGRATAPHQAAPSRRVAPTVEVGEAGDTPILREYRAVRAEHPDSVILVRLGDFYELLGQDAELGATLLGLTLTGRGFGNAGRVPMCGMPHHAVSQYLRRLLDAGHRVVVWDQLPQEPALAHVNVIQRAVTRVLSPGMLVDEDLVEPSMVARCVALLPLPGRVGLAALDVTAGELQLCEYPGGLDSPALADECTRLGAAQLLLPESVEVPPSLPGGALCTLLPAAWWDGERGRERLQEVTGTASLRGLDVDTLGVAHGAAGALLQHCARSRLALPPGFVQVRRRHTGSVMRLDSTARRTLELLTPLSGAAASGSLLSLLDRTRTPMGARLLRTRLLEPLRDPAAIDERLDAVTMLVENPVPAAALHDRLARVGDLERLVARCVQGIASPRDLGAIRTTVAALVPLRELAAGLEAPELTTAAQRCRAPEPLCTLLRHLLVDDPPATARDGGAIRDGADAELDSLRAAGSDARGYIAGLEAQEREATGIRSLRVGYNRVFGYYLEVPNTQRTAIPDHYLRKQTLVGAERYITPEMKHQETVVLGARDRAIARELELLRECTAAAAQAAEVLLDAARAVAVLDVSHALAEVARAGRWVRPVVDSSDHLVIEGGRHPLVERSLGPGRFVANDCGLDCDDTQLVVLTGPNMAGKSTYLRQVALIVVLAQVGSFVPAARARVGACDRIFTRIGAQDDLAGGLSTFMVEMAETATILNSATRRSLVILDEVGRGTSTHDGLCIAQAVIEHLHDAPHLGCRTLFATHYHELTALAEVLPRMRNARVEVIEDGERITFVHRIVAGGADRSYGIHVARLAGVPAGVITRARRLLAEREQAGERRSGAGTTQLDLGLLSEPITHPIVEQLEQLDLDGLTPLAALNQLAEWRQRLSG